MTNSEQMKLRRLINIFTIYILLCFGEPSATAGLVTDQLGRKVLIPENPQRIISLAPNITEIIFALNCENRLKGVTLHCDFPIEAKLLPKVGSYVGLDLEKIVALKPDLCIAIKDGNPKYVADRLESFGIPVYAVDPRNLDSVMKTIISIGGLLGADKRAHILVNNMRSRIKHITEIVASSSDRPRVFFQIGAAPVVSVGTDTYIHELIMMAGGVNVTAGETTYPRFSREQLIALSPDVVVITSMTRSDAFEQVLVEWNKWPQIQAVRNKRVYMADSDLFDRPSPRLVDGLEALVNLIHPELYRNKK
ncbi:MAG: cobalamin-binding protein [Desulfobacterales bacterium]